MKKVFLFLSIVFTLNTNAQLQFTTQSDGIVDVAYGNNYTLFDPQGATEIYMYLWVDINQTTPAISMTYNDDWNNSSGFVVLTYSATEDKFLGQINFNTHNFDGEGVLPQGTQLNDFNFILRNQAGDSQTGNQLASAYGFSSTTTLGVYNYQAEKNSYYSNGFLNINNNDSSYQLTIYNLNGQLINNVNTNASLINLTHLKKQVIIIFIKSKSKYFIKKIQL